jgi:hypothetical protein
MDPVREARPVSAAAGVDMVTTMVEGRKGLSKWWQMEEEARKARKRRGTVICSGPRK